MGTGFQLQMIKKFLKEIMVFNRIDMLSTIEIYIKTLKYSIQILAHYKAIKIEYRQDKVKGRKYTHLN